jgi:D-proline reductase (dithiol) PrdB
MSADAQTRKAAAAMPPLTFAKMPFTKPPALRNAKVAIVTTAALLAEGQRDWVQGEQTFRVIDRGQRDLRMAHWSLNYDRTGFTSDLNVVFPIDRLDELAKNGIIGGVAPRHLAFMGALHDTLSTIRLDTGPAAAKLLRDDGTDVVVITGV